MMQNFILQALLAFSLTAIETKLAQRLGLPVTFEFVSMPVSSYLYRSDGIQDTIRWCFPWTLCRTRETFQDHDDIASTLSLCIKALEASKLPSHVVSE